MFEDTDSGVIEGALSSGGKVQGLLLSASTGSSAARFNRTDVSALSSRTTQSATARAASSTPTNCPRMASPKRRSRRSATPLGPTRTTLSPLSLMTRRPPSWPSTPLRSALRRRLRRPGGDARRERGRYDAVSPPAPRRSADVPRDGCATRRTRRLRRRDPELLTEKVDRYESEFDLGSGLAEQVAYGQRWPLFEALCDEGVDPTLAAGTLESTLTELRRDDVPVENLTDNHLQGAILLVDGGDVPREGMEDLRRHSPRTRH